ncbi:ATP-binding protein [Candidatus Aminicenantes bacterium AC-708-I09]|nr:ATP-binding protein [Candidatus Aminicenantes bacterium AC-708-I09]
MFTIIQDKQGFMWFGTEDGLNRYDGYEFKVYRNDHDNLNSLNYNYIKVIYEDSKGNLWIGTYGGGLDKFNPQQEKFIHYKYEVDNPYSLSNNYVTSIFEDKFGVLWIGTEEGLNKFDSKKGRFIRYKHDINNPDSLSSDFITCIYEDSKGILWIGTENGLNKFDRENERFIHYFHEPKNPHSISNNYIYSIYEDHLGNLWIGTYGGGLNRFDRKTGKFIHYKYNARNPNSLSNNYVRVIYEDSSGTLWIGTEDGLNQFNRKSENFFRFKHRPYDLNSLSNNEIYSIFEDRAGVLWIGTRVGLNKLNQKSKQFIHYYSIPNDPNSLSNNYVRAIYEDDDGILWIGTYGGLNKFNRKKGIFKHYIANPNDLTSLSSNRVMAICGDGPNILWIGTENGLNKFNKKTEKFIHFKSEIGNPWSLSSNFIRVVYKDRDGNLWIGTDNGLNKFERKTGKFIHYKHNPKDPNSISNNFIYSIFEDSRGTLWIGTLKGLNKFDRKKNIFKKYFVIPGDSRSLNNNEILSIYEDSRGILWVGTAEGLNKFDRNREIFTHYTTKDGLPNNLIYDILEDREGNLWLSTNKGLSKFNPVQEKFRNYDVSDGLQSNEFSKGACFKSKSGEMFFGGINGFNSFYPEKIKDNPYPPQIVITDFKVFNKSISIGEKFDGMIILEKSITNTKEIILSHKHRFFSIEFSALHFVSPKKNQYAYKMEGFDREWNYVGNRNFATYTNLPPGEYTFRVKASNSDGVWNDEGLSLKIKILPPFWMTWWFRGIILIFILVALISAYHARTYAIRKRAHHLERVIGRRTSELERVNEELRKEIIERKRIEEKLQTEKAYLDQLFESAQEAVVMTDNSGRIIRINKEFTKMFGYSEEEALGNFIDDLVAPENLREEALFYTEKLARGEKIAFESVRRRKDGSLINVLSIGAPIIVNNEQVAIYAIYLDITERKKSEEETKKRATQFALLYKIGQRISSKLELKALFKEIVTAIRDAFNYYGVMLFLLDEETGYLKLQAIVGGYVDVFPKDLRIKIGEGMIGRAAETGETQVSGDVSKNPYYIRKANEITKSELSVPIKRGKKVIGVLDIQCDEYNAFDESDISAMETLSTQIAIAIENAKLFEQAQREILERKKAEEKLKKTAEALERSNKELQHFAYIASHDLQEPLRMVASFVQLLAKRYKGKLGPDADEFIKYAVEGANRMQKMINDLLLYSRVETRGKPFIPTDCEKVLEKVIANLKVSIEERGAIVTHDELPIVMADESQLIQLFQNLISNAIKFCDKKTPRIHISVNKKNDEWVFSVKDNGIGIDPEYKDRIFQIFQRLHLRDEYPGTGIGLAICKKIVERHGGRIWVESKVGEGSTFYFTIPIRRRNNE